MTKDGARTQQGPESPASPPTASAQHQDNCEYPAQLTKADLEDSLSAMYNKLAEKFQTELHKTTSTLTQEITALGTRTDLLETKHDELALAHADLHLMSLHRPLCVTGSTGLCVQSHLLINLPGISYFV